MKPPEQFLKKGEGIGQPPKKSDHKCIIGNLPAVPRCPPPEKVKEKPKINIRVRNMKAVLKAKPRPVEPRYPNSLCTQNNKLPITFYSHFILNFNNSNFILIH